MVIETWFDVSIVLNGVILQNYDVFHNGRNCHGGGVMILCDKVLNTQPVDNTYTVNFEKILCHFIIVYDKFIFGCVYRPPSSFINYLNCITDSLDNLCKNIPANKLIIADDFNLPNIDWSVPKPTINDNLTNTFVQNILCNSFDQIVTMSTRENNVLDLVLCRNLDPLPYVNIIPPLIGTDQEFIQFCLPIYSINYKVKESIYHKIFQKTNYYDMNEYIMNINWALELSRFTNVNDRCNVFFL